MILEYNAHLTRLATGFWLSAISQLFSAAELKKWSVETIGRLNFSFNNEFHHLNIQLLFIKDKNIESIHCMQKNKIIILFVTNHRCLIF